MKKRESYIAPISIQNQELISWVKALQEDRRFSEIGEKALTEYMQNQQGAVTNRALLLEILTLLKTGQIQAVTPAAVMACEKMEGLDDELKSAGF